MLFQNTKDSVLEHRLWPDIPVGHCGFPPDGPHRHSPAAPVQEGKAVLPLMGSGIDSGSVIGLVVLFGLAVNNAIILYEVSGEYQNRGLSLALAAYRGARDRLNPILATTATTLLALLPVMISPLDAVQRSMAAAMFGGVAASTLISLLVLPPLLTWFRAVPGEVDR